MENESYVYSRERVRALQESGFLDSQEDYVHLAFAAYKMLEADLCQINALGDTHQKTVAAFPFREFAKLPVTDSVCKFVVEKKTHLCIDNTKKSDKTSNFDWNKEYLSYIGSPIFHNGEIVGSVCLLNKEERVWKDEEINALEAIAALIGMKLKK